MDYTAPIFPKCNCVNFHNGASSSAVSDMCEKPSVHDGSTCFPLNYEDNRKVGGAHFYACAEDMCVPSPPPAGGSTNTVYLTLPDSHAKPEPVPKLEPRPKR